MKFVSVLWPFPILKCRKQTKQTKEIFDENCKLYLKITISNCNQNKGTIIAIRLWRKYSDILPTTEPKTDKASQKMARFPSKNSQLPHSLSPKNEAFLAPTMSTKTKCTHTQPKASRRMNPSECHHWTWKASSKQAPNKYFGGFACEIPARLFSTILLR